MSDAPTPFLPVSLADWLEVCAKVLLIVGTLVGAAWAYLEYSHKEDQRRIEGTLGYVKRFSEGNLAESTRRIGGLWYASQNQLQHLRDTAAGADFQRRHQQLVMSVIEQGVLVDKDGKASRGAVADVDAVTTFFSELAICVKARLCDATSAHAFFDDYARRFYCLHEPYLTWKAEHYSASFGQNLAGFAAVDPRKCHEGR